MANREGAVCLEHRDTVEEMQVRVREDDTIQRGFVSAGLRKKENECEEMYARTS
jgi:hypothetical protein